MSRRVNKKHQARRDRKSRAAPLRRRRKLIRTATKRTKGTYSALRKFSAGDAERAIRKNGAPIHSNRAPWIRNPKTELEAAIQRFVDLYDFAPIAYVSCDRAGRIEEANLAATDLLGESRDLLIGRPFAFYVGDLDSFMHHLLYCRTSQQLVETELQLKPRKGERNPALLCSTPITSTTRNGALLYQTAIMDLSERKAAEAKLRASEERYRTLFNLGPVAVYSIDTSGRIDTFNRRAAELWGCEPALGDTDQRFCGSFKMFRPDGSFMPHEQCPMAEVLSGKITAAHDAEVLIERPDGSRVTVLVNIRPLKNDRGEVIGAINCFYDITERKRAETAASRLAAVVQSSHDAIVAKDLNGIIADWNQSAERIFGYGPKEIIGKSVLTLIPKDRHSEEQDILKRIRRGELVDHYETVRRCKDGTLINVSLTISPVKDLNGKIIGISKIVRDITRQKRAEQRVAEQSRLLDLSNEAILVRDTQDRITYWNRGANELYGYLPEEALGKVTHKLLRTEFPESLKSIYKKLERDDRWSGELVHKRKDGTKVVVMSHWALDRDGHGRSAFVLETNADITQRKQTEAALQRSKEMLEKLVQ